MNAESEISYIDYTQWYEPSESYFKKDVSFWTRAAQTAWSATGIGDFVDAALGYELITGDMNTLKESNWKVVEGMFETALLCLPGVMNAGGGGKAVLCAVGKELGENMVMDTMYEAMEAGGCSEARSILNAVLTFRTVYSVWNMVNSAMDAKRFRDAYEDKDWDDWVKRAEGTGKNSDVPEYPKGVVQGKSGKTIITSTAGNEIDVTPSSKHTSVNKNPGPYGEANTSVDILDAEGNIKTRRWYDSDGKAYRDVDMSDHGNPKEHPEVPHEHTWEYNNGKPKRN